MSVDKTWDVVIVGGGIVGAATLYKMQVRFPKLAILLIEKEEALADHQTGHNSGVIHSGIYYKPGSYKAKNCVEGRHELVAFAKEHRIAHDICGKLIVATTHDELPRLEKIWNTGQTNRIEDMQRVTPEQIREIEPECAGIAGIRVGCTGIIDFRGATNKMAELACGINPESSVHLGETVTGTEHGEGVSIIRTTRASYRTKHAVFCAGLQSDRLAKADGVTFPERVVGFRGDYFELSDQGKHKVKHLIYPVPDPRFPFLGVHFTRMTDGSIECGPNAVFTFKREGYGKTDFDLSDTLDALTYGGTWKLFFNNMSYGIDEYRRAFSKKLFLKTLRRLVPSLTMEDLKPGRAGVRAMLLGTDGAMVDDFRIERKGTHVHVLNAPSPAATAALAIGGTITRMAMEELRVGEAVR
ncbi:MAG: L-2-hydroxyglutarate oxidase [Flavobacteriales bacterium]|nr:L-2-hydroxyglutarate oxidase [Flavobacteriales bacterium]MBP6696344.1 L-2-hydroxyglutarate oxidase [Flavobacteriales bacterium]